MCNGIEVAGGSIRAHDPKMLKSVFEIMSNTEEEIDNKFGHMLKALGMGTPPHGGCAQETMDPFFEPPDSPWPGCVWRSQAEPRGMQDRQPL